MSKRKYIELTLEKKKEVLDLMDNGLSQRKLAALFGVSNGTIAGIKSSRVSILESWLQNVDPKRKRVKRSSPNDEVNGLVFLYFVESRQNNIPITGPMLQEKALEAAANLNLMDFKASNGWLESFRKRHNIQFSQLYGESASADIAAAEDWKAKLLGLLEGYSPDDIFNADESGFFYRLLPSKSLVLKGEKCKGGKMSKERLTVLFCCSAGGEKLKPLVIGNVEKPHAFEGIKADSLPVIWRANKMSWMTQVIFVDWLNEVNKQMKKVKRKILLIVDNASSHLAPPLSNVSVLFLPPNLTSEIQPLHRGIINNVKVNYRKSLLRKLVAECETSPSVFELCKKITVLDAVKFIHSAWESVAVSTIIKCFAQYGICPAGHEQIQDDEEFEIPAALQDQVSEKYNFDNDLLVCEEGTDAAQTSGNGEGDSASDNDSDQEQLELAVAVGPISNTQALSSVQLLQQFALQKHPQLLPLFLTVQRKLEGAIIKSTKQQKSITDHFSLV